MSIEKVIYRAHAKATGGREGRAVSSDNVLDVQLTTPLELGGAGNVGTNPEQLFAAGYSACFLGAMKFVASRDKPYGALVDDAMAIMNDGMARAPMNGQADHDFAAMMIPHHQGAVDMAKAELLYGTNPVLRRLAQEIIVTQGQEIQVMQLELKKIPTAAPARP